MKIAFVWQGVSEPHVWRRWDDGLRQAMRYIEQDHEVTYCEPWHDIKADLILYWEAPCTINGKNGEHYRRIKDLPIKKALLFAGGPVQRQWCEGFDLIFTESQINDQEFTVLGLPWKRAFGVNDLIFKPLNTPKLYEAMMHATFAEWKRHKLFAETFKGTKSALCGRYQPSDPAGYDACVAAGLDIYPELWPEQVSLLINQSKIVVNTSEYWGGGQRCTLEAMACNVPVIVMSDSPKNREYVDESGAGVVVDPDPNTIRQAVAEILEHPEQYRGREYIESKWTARHYANSLLAGINQL